MNERFTLNNDACQFSSKACFRNSMHFFTPLKGVVAAGYDRVLHPGIDISAPTGSVVSAVLDGTVVFSGWDAEQGYFLVLQHRDNLLSVYSNNQKLLRGNGDTVGAGTPIALVGDTQKSTERREVRSRNLPSNIPFIISLAIQAQASASLVFSD